MTAVIDKGRVLAVMQRVRQVNETTSQDAIHLAARQLIDACGGDHVQALILLVREFGVASSQVQQLVQTIKGITSHLEQQPRLARVLSGVVKLDGNGTERRIIYTTPLGRQFAQVSGSLLLDGLRDEDVPPPLALCVTDATGAAFLGGASVELPLEAEEVAVQSANADTRLDGVGEIVEQGTGDRRAVYYCRAELAAAVAGKLKEGEPVSVRVEGGIAVKVVGSAATEALPDWLSFPDVAACPPLSEMVFPEWLRKAWERDADFMMKNRPQRWAVFGPTGTGKTEAVKRCACEAGRKSGRKVAMIHMSAPHIVSPYYGETERTLRRAFVRAEKLAQQGCIVVVFVDEADALLGDPAGRYEGSVDRRVRLAFQELTSSDVPGVSVYLTFNASAHSWIATAIDRRFRKRNVPRTTRTQMARVAGLYASRQALARLGMPPDDLGQQLADFLYSDSFVVASVNFHSGHAADVHARDLHTCSPGKIRDIVVDFCLDVEDGQGDASLHGLWTRLEREFRSVVLSPANLFEMTFLPEPAHDHVATIGPPPGMGSTTSSA